MATGLQERVQGAVRGLTPGYFALVMGSGIISVGMLLEGHVELSVLLLVVCAVSYVVLVVLTGWRLLAFRREVVRDFTDPRRAFGFLTFVAGTDVLGVRLALDGHHATTGVLLVVAATTWLVLGYVIPWTAVLGGGERPVVANANGTWFIWVVASQSVATAAPPSSRYSPRYATDSRSWRCSPGRWGSFCTRPRVSSSPPG